MKVGVIGCGNISGIYFENGMKLPGLEIVAVADMDMERARATADKQGIARALTVDAMIADSEVEAILNITTPDGHAPLNIRALEAGKHAYVEKPLALDLADGVAQVELARRKGLRLGGAPDTVLGAGIQTCRKLLDDGGIGEVFGGNAVMLGGGVETWHPNPVFYYKKGGGPMFDMGPYYLTALVTLLGPVKRVMGATRKAHARRTITSQPFAGQVIDVEIPTHVAGLLEFQSGAVVTMTTSFDCMGGSRIPPIELYGSEGTLAVPDPNTFGGPVQVRRRGEREWSDVALTHGHDANARGIGLSDMAEAIAQKRPHRASGELMLHVLEVMHAFHVSSDAGAPVEIKNQCPRPEAMPPL